MKNIRCLGLLVWLVALGMACERSPLATPEVRLRIQLRADVEAQPTAVRPLLRLQGDSYTPAAYTLGARSWGLITCYDAANKPMVCAAPAGVEVERYQGVADTFHVDILTEKSNAYRIYAEGRSPPLTLSAFALTTPASYSGVQVSIDFIMTRFPLEAAAQEIPAFHSVLYCLNKKGCGQNMASYSSPTLTALADGNVQFGDLVFYEGNEQHWYYWDMIHLRAVSIADRAPAERLRQSDGSARLPFDAERGSWVYNASFGIAQGNSPVRSWEALVTEKALALALVFSVDQAMTFDDVNGNHVMEADEMWSLRFGKPRITDVRLPLLAIPQ